MMIHKAIYPRDDIDYMSLKKEEEDPPVLKIASMNQYEDIKITFKRAKKD